MEKQPPPEYQAALDYIYSFVDFSRTHQENLSPENFDLSRMVQFMALIGEPHKDFPSLHIAGSKGKGSVSALCASALQQAGYQVGLYTSPHLKDFEERIQINQLPISREILVSLVDEIKPAVSRIHGLTTFEITTGLAFLHFARQGVDIAVIEVGLGGRLDATNVISPVVSVITSLYLDHTSILGDTIEQIAAEKGGIIKPGVPVVCAPQEVQARAVIRRIAEEKSAPLVEIDREYKFKLLDRSLDGQMFQVRKEKDQQLLELTIPLLGEYQIINTVLAYAALEELRAHGIPISEEHITRGFLEVVWPGRFEVLRKQPPLIVDSAHNPASMGKLRETIDDFFPDLPLVLVFGISEDKQLDGMLQEILPRTTHLITTQADHPRAMDPEELAQRAGAYDCLIESIPDVGEALKRGLSLVEEKNLLVVTGSIFVAASARIAWFEGR
jgi:dihydrofolate synthase/folylpolyglutamate synthase